MKKSIMLRITALAIATSLTPTHAEGRKNTEIRELNGKLQAKTSDINSKLKRDNEALLKAIQNDYPSAKLLEENTLDDQGDLLNTLHDGALKVATRTENEIETVRKKTAGLQFNRALHKAIDAKAELAKANKELEEKNKEIKEKSKELEEKNKEIKEKSKELTEQTEKIKALEKTKDDLEQKEDDLEKRRSSRSGYWF